ncbi:MAG: phosphoribosylglycinamide formyltransferase [Oscillospiraceae bacterium]|nr:phosphoribosylglycinamide formyltransferase [Oscillospiraceae bacterium]
MADELMQETKASAKKTLEDHPLMTGDALGVAEENWRDPREGVDIPRKKIVVLVSGGGTNLQALIDAQNRGELGGGRITCVISSRADAYALVRAKENGIPTRVIPRKSFDSVEAYSAAMLEAFYEEYADLIVQAGFMTILDKSICRAYPNKMMNVHPALIPSFCGKGFYGLHVHEAALEKGVKVTGATVHFVNEICDGGPIILQKAVEIQQDDTPETLQRRVMEEAEWKILPEAVRLFCEDKISVCDGKVYISE